MVFLLSFVDGKRERREFDEAIKVRELVKLAAEMTALPEDRVRLLRCGRVLNDGTKDDLALTEFGVKGGSSVHVLKIPRRDPVPPAEPKELSDEEVRRFFLAFGMVLTKPDLAAIVRRLTDSRESLEMLAATCPGLAGDPLALAALSRPEMLLMLMKKETLRKVAREHPALTEAMDNLAAAVHEEVAARGGGSGARQEPTPPPALNPFEYALDDMEPLDEDEDEDDDDMGMGGPAGGAAANDPNAIQRNRSFSAITPNQLAAAIMNAQAASGGGGGGAGGAASAAANVFGGLFQGMTGMAPRQQQQQQPQQQQPSAPQPSSSSSAAAAAAAASSPGGRITTDMFRAAMAQAMAATTPGGAGPSVPMETSSSSQEDKKLEESLKSMREMGIADENLARKALKVMDGDLQAAVDLVLSGWLGEEDSAN